MRRLLTDDPHLRRMLELATLLGAEMGDFGSGTSNAFTQATSVQTKTVLTSETTASAAYTDLATVGPAVTITPGPSGIAVVTVGAFVSDTVANDFGLFTFAATVGNTIAAADSNAVQGTSFSAGVGATFTGAIALTALTVASTTFTMKYRTNGGTCTFSARTITVITY